MRGVNRNGGWAARLKPVPFPCSLDRDWTAEAAVPACFIPAR
jgi:hypothetical protein